MGNPPKTSTGTKLLRLFEPKARVSHPSITRRCCARLRKHHFPSTPGKISAFLICEVMSQPRVCRQRKEKKKILLFIKRFGELLLPAGILGRRRNFGHPFGSWGGLWLRSGAAFPHQHIRVSLREDLSIAQKPKGGSEQRFLIFVVVPAAPRGEGSSCSNRGAAPATLWK